VLTVRAVRWAIEALAEMTPLSPRRPAIWVWTGTPPGTRSRSKPDHAPATRSD
jgi:hypothetical protein